MDRMKEYRWAVFAALIVILLGSVPLILGYALQTPELRFVGVMYDRQDYSVHLSELHHGAAGGWDYLFGFTTEAHQSSYLKTFYVVLGHIAVWLGLPLDIAYQLARVLCGLLACLSIYRLLTRIFPEVNQRRLGFFLVALGSGFGWIQTPFRLLPDPLIWPIDIWLIDAYVFFSIAIFPHFSAIIAALALAITAFLDHLERPAWANVVLILVCALFTQIVNPMAFLLADCAMLGAFIFSCWQKRKLDWASALTLGGVAIAQIPLFVYSWLLLKTDPVWAVFSDPDLFPTPPLAYVILGFGPFWPFAIVGALRALRKPNPGAGLALVWLVAALILIYLPLQIQRRMLLMVTIPLTILALAPIFDFSAWLRARIPAVKSLGLALTSGLAMIGSFFLILLYSINVSTRPANLFEPAPLIEAMEWLKQHATTNDVVLASEPTAQLVALRTPARLYFGHEIETLHFDQKASQVENFYRGLQPATWLESLHVDWVIFGPHEQEWSTTPPRSALLQPVYKNDQVTIYRVGSP